MMDEVIKINRGLEFLPDGDHHLARQIVKHLAGPETVAPVLFSLAVWSDGWPDCKVAFREQVLLNRETWLEILAAFSPIDRLYFTLRTLRAFGDLPKAVEKELSEIRRLASCALERRFGKSVAQVH